MEYLHKNKEDFLEAINIASQMYGMVPTVIEKDYYVTMILRRLAEEHEYVVFKGGTSLSKCHKIIKRFSEDIDITIDVKLSRKQKRDLKETLINIAEEMQLIISNIDDIRSGMDYNQYILQYDSVVSEFESVVPAQVLVETSYAEVSFPTVVLPIYSYIGDMMKSEAPDEIKTYNLDPFDMKVQGFERTFVDKVFAICDYYLKGNVQKHSRHIYDIYKLFPLVCELPREELKKLVNDVRKERAKLKSCPSACEGVNVVELLEKIIYDKVYKEDYDNITNRLLDEKVEYEVAIEAIIEIASYGLFE